MVDLSLNFTFPNNSTYRREKSNLKYIWIEDLFSDVLITSM